MKKFFTLFLSIALLLLFSACTLNNNSYSEDKNPISEKSEATQADTITVQLADGTQMPATYENGFYSFANSKKVQLKELEYQKNRPESGYAQLKLILQGDTEYAIAFMLKKEVAHADYQTAWENAEYVAYADVLTEDGLFGVNCEWVLPENISDYEIRVFDDRTLDNPIEIGFIILQ